MLFRSWSNAVRREIGEELGLKVLAEKLVGIYSDPELTVTAKPLEEGHFGQFIVASFLILKFEGEIHPNDEVDRWDWFNLETLPSPIIKSHPVRIQDALEFNGEVFVR